MFYIARLYVCVFYCLFLWAINKSDEKNDDYNIDDAIPSSIFEGLHLIMRQTTGLTGYIGPLIPTFVR